MNVAVRHCSDNILECVRDYSHGPEYITDTPVAEEQVHWLVEGPLLKYQHHQADVGHHDKDVDGEEENEGRDGGNGADL